MTPKQRANELVEDFKFYAYANPSNESELFYKILKQNAKKCASIAVELAKENTLNSDGYNKYLDEIKKEIK